MLAQTWRSTQPVGRPVIAVKFVGSHFQTCTKTSQTRYDKFTYVR